MQKKFLTNIALLLFLNLLVKPFWVLGIDRSVQNAVGAGDFGFYFSILNYTFLFNILLDFGITNFNNRNIAQNSQLLNKHFSGILILKILLAVIYAAVTFAVGLIIGYDSAHFKMLGWISLNQFLLSFILYLRSNISGLLLFKTDSFLSVLDRLLMIAICSVLLWGNILNSPFRIEWFVFAQTAAYGLTALVAFLIVINKAAFRKLSWNWPFLLMILKKSLPFALLFLLMAQYNRIDTVIIERLLPDKTGEEQSGIYAQAFRLLDAANMIAYLFAVILLPIFSKMIKLNQPPDKLVRLSFTLLFTTSVILAVGSCFYSTEIMKWLYPPHSSETQAGYLLRISQSAFILSLLMFGFVAISMIYVFSTLLTANGNLKALNIIAACGVVISLTVNLALVPRIQAAGSAYASLGAQFATAIAQMVVAIRLFRFRISYRFVSSLVIFTASVLLITYLSGLMNFDWRISFLVMMALSTGMAVILRLLNIREFINIIRS
jgi:O-antigen/teichoic acid export membrane protein